MTRPVSSSSHLIGLQLACTVKASEFCKFCLCRKHVLVSIINFQAALAANNHGVENWEKFVQVRPLRQLIPQFRSWHKNCKRKKMLFRCTGEIISVTLQFVHGIKMAKEKRGYSDTFIRTVLQTDHSVQQLRTPSK